MIDRKSFDGTVAEPELVEATDIEPELTYLCLMARTHDGFVVMNGSDWGLPAFDDAQLAQIMITFNETVDDFPYADSATLKVALASALAGMWAPCKGVMNCPFDQHIVGPARLIFHLHMTGWGFEEARLKFKTEGAEKLFGGLDWLELHGESQKPHSFQIDARAVDKKAENEFALYIAASQNAGQQVTRIIIDPVVTTESGSS